MGVTLIKIVEKMELRNLTPDVDMTQREVKIPDINRPALQLAGFFDHFDCERIQLIGYVEYAYLQTLEYEHKMKIYDTLLEYGIPCFIFCRNLQPDPEFLEKAVKNNIPVFITDTDFFLFSRTDPLDESGTGTVYFNSRGTGGLLWSRCSDHGRQRYR